VTCIQPHSPDVLSTIVVFGKTLQIVILVGLVAFAIAYPVIESLDHWDPAGPASDSELEAIGMLTLAGAISLLTQLITFLSASVSSKVPPPFVHQLAS
jgi:hypothetical protein